MRIRSAIACTLAGAAIAGGTLGGIAFARLPADGLPVAWLLDAAACFLVFLLGYTVRGGAHSIAILLTIFALCLPVAGPGIAALLGLSIHFMRPAREVDEPYQVGNPVTERGKTGMPAAVLGHPLVESVRHLSQLDLVRLVNGLGSFPPGDVRPVLLRLRDAGDDQLQLFAQGGLNDPIEAADAQLRSLTRRAIAHPGEAATHCAIAEIHLYLLENHLVEAGDRPATWDAACEAIGDALRADPCDAQSLQVCARLNLIGGDPNKARLAAESLAKLPGHGENASLILAEAAFETGDLESVAEKLAGVTPGASDRDDILDFWLKPKPTAYV